MKLAKKIARLGLLLALSLILFLVENLFPPLFPPQPASVKSITAASSRLMIRFIAHSSHALQIEKDKFNFTTFSRKNNRPPGA